MVNRSSRARSNRLKNLGTYNYRYPFVEAVSFPRFIDLAGFPENKNDLGPIHSSLFIKQIPPARHDRYADGSCCIFRYPSALATIFRPKYHSEYLLV